MAGLVIPLTWIRLIQEEHGGEEGRTGCCHGEPFGVALHRLYRDLCRLGIVSLDRRNGRYSRLREDISYKGEMRL